VETEKISPEGKALAEKELQERQVKREHIRQAIKEAREEGDLSENAEYHAAREDQGMNEARITSLEAQLSRAEVIETPESSDIAIVGSEVHFEDLDSDRKWEVILAHPLEAGKREECLSVDSPIGKALLHQKEGDVIEVKAPKSSKRLKVTKIS
jgi:transcription elongation factor GreA